MTKLCTKHSPAATVEDRRCGAREPTKFPSPSPGQWTEMRTRLAAAGYGGTLSEGVPLRVNVLMGLVWPQAAEEETP